METRESKQIDEINIRDLIKYFISLFYFLKSKVFIISVVVVLGATAGYLYAFTSPKYYTAKLTFALEEEKASGGGFAGAMGLASSLGIDLGGGGGGVFTGANLIELMKSRLIVEKTLLSTVSVNGKTTTLANYYLELTKNKDESNDLNKINFPPNTNRSTFSFKQDSLLGKMYSSIAGKGGIFKVFQADKKVSILTVETKSTDEFFAKYFTEMVVKEVSDFYIDTKSKKAKLNFEILQRQTDSVRRELNAAITGVAVVNDNTFNLNAAMLAPKAAGMRRQVDVQANTAILTQLVANLEMSKVTLRKETPLIQIIDRPILPLQIEKASKLKSLVIGAFLGGIFIISLLLFNKWRKTIVL